jgi:hypothetical protein
MEARSSAALQATVNIVGELERRGGETFSLYDAQSRNHPLHFFLVIKDSRGRYLGDVHLVEEGVRGYRKDRVPDTCVDYPQVTAKGSIIASVLKGASTTPHNYVFNNCQGWTTRVVLAIDHAANWTPDDYEINLPADF